MFSVLNFWMKSECFKWHTHLFNNTQFTFLEYISNYSSSPVWNCNRSRYEPHEKRCFRRHVFHCKQPMSFFCIVSRMYDNPLKTVHVIFYHRYILFAYIWITIDKYLKNHNLHLFTTFRNIRRQLPDTTTKTQNEENPQEINRLLLIYTHF